MKSKGKARTPSKAKDGRAGSAGSVYEQPPRHSGTPGTSRPGRSQTVNESITRPGSGTGGDGTKVRKPGDFC